MSLKRPAASGAGQPAHISAEHLPSVGRLFEPMDSGVSAAQPDLSLVYTFHAYTVGRVLLTKHTTKWLCGEVVRL